MYTAQIKQFGIKIKKLREDKGLTQQALADKCDVDIRTIQRVEVGDSGIGLHILFALAEALEMPSYQLLKNIRLGNDNTV